MIIAVDEAIPYLQPAFSPLGELRLFSGRAARAADLRDADALVVRSVTRVGPDLLDGSSVRFVGTATIGTDHLDLNYLAARGIHVANAAGSNANAVSEYVTSALLVSAARRGWNLSEKSLGIIGVGRVGSLVERKAAALGMRVMLCDPPLRESTGESRYGFFDDVAGADILTLHVPLTSDGPYPTRHMIARAALERLSPLQVIINSSRGAVVCGHDLKRALIEKRIGGAILDVWEGEPNIDRELVGLVDLGTAHIAGSSLDGKVAGTQMVLSALCRFFGLRQTWDGRDVFPPPRRLSPNAGAKGQEAFESVVLRAYDIRQDDASLRALTGAAGGAAGERFDRYRIDYPFRIEFPHFIVEHVREPELARALEALGFVVDQGNSRGRAGAPPGRS
jgi:erythronate-4-phosphate dehydrogenase